MAAILLLSFEIIAWDTSDFKELTKTDRTRTVNGVLGCSTNIGSSSAPEMTLQEFAADEKP